MDVREKLEVIAHLGDHISHKEDIGICYDSALAKVIEDAYMALKNGVTVQEWISVTERLPESGKQALCFTKRGGFWVAVWDDVGDHLWSDGEIWCSNGYVTHWMPLPPAPEDAK